MHCLTHSVPLLMTIGAEKRCVAGGAAAVVLGRYRPVRAKPRTIVIAGFDWIQTRVVAHGAVVWARDLCGGIVVAAVAALQIDPLPIIILVLCMAELAIDLCRFENGIMRFMIEHIKDRGSKRPGRAEQSNEYENRNH